MHDLEDTFIRLMLLVTFTYTISRLGIDRTKVLVLALTCFVIFTNHVSTAGNAIAYPSVCFHLTFDLDLLHAY